MLFLLKELERGSLTYKRILVFWAPLALVQICQRISRPIVNLFVARERLGGVTPEEAVKVLILFYLIWKAFCTFRISCPSLCFDSGNAGSFRKVFVSGSSHRSISFRFLYDLKILLSFKAVAVLSVSYPIGHLPYGWLNTLRSVEPAFKKVAKVSFVNINAAV